MSNSRYAEEVVNRRRQTLGRQEPIEWLEEGYKLDNRTIMGSKKKFKVIFAGETREIELKLIGVGYIDNLYYCIDGEVREWLDQHGNDQLKYKLCFDDNRKVKYGLKGSNLCKYVIVDRNQDTINL